MAEGLEYFYKAKVDRVVDGDTIDFIVDLGFSVFHKIRVRLYGVNTPESRTKDLQEKALGLAAKEYVDDWFDGCANVFIQTLKDSGGKYGRILAYVYADAAKTACLNTQIIDAGHGVEYFGGKR